MKNQFKIQKTSLQDRKDCIRNNAKENTKISNPNSKPRKRYGERMILLRSLKLNNKRKTFYLKM